MSPASQSRPLRDRLAAGEPLVGIFVKTPSHQIVEILYGSGLDFIVFDAEHAPFGAASLDICLFAARAIGMPALVRLPDDSPSGILRVLDLGATGVLVPHVDTPAKAEAVARHARFGQGGRGFSNSTRAGDYRGKSIAAYLEEAGAETIVVAQIEDPDGVENAAAIAGVGGIDALFIGRADLTVGYGKTALDDPAVDAAVKRICKAGREAGRTVGMFLGGVGDAAAWRKEGVTLFAFGSEHNFIQEGAARLAAAFREGAK